MNGAASCRTRHLQERRGEHLVDTIEQVNMLPELIRMQCSMMGVGEEHGGGETLQLRTLDFGGGPFGNHTMFAVSHPRNSGNAFATVGFAFVGAVTGFSEHMACAKRWMTCAPKPKIKGSATAKRTLCYPRHH